VSVPKTSTYEDNLAAGDENEVGAASETPNMQPVAEAKTVDQSPDE